MNNYQAKNKKNAGGKSLVKYLKNTFVYLKKADY